MDIFGEAGPQASSHLVCRLKEYFGVKVLRVETSSATGTINCKHFSKLGGFVGEF